MMDDNDLDAYIARIKREQQACLNDEMPAKIADVFSTIFGDGWRCVPHIASQYAEAVEIVRAQLGGLCGATNADAPLRTATDCHWQSS
jgi:hypothetical protein